MVTRSGLRKWIAREKPPCARRRGNREEATMNILLWVLQVLAALLYGSSGVMKVFMFDKVSQDVPSFGALPRKAWMTLGILELVSTVGLIVPAAFHWHPPLTILAATVWRSRASCSSGCTSNTASSR